LKDLPAWITIAVLIVLPTLTAVIAAGREILSLRLESKNLTYTVLNNKQRLDALETQSRACLLVASDVKQHRLELDSANLICDALDARLDIQNRTLDRVETKLDILLKSFENAVVRNTSHR
jgi:hypothetical protein